MKKQLTYFLTFLIITGFIEISSAQVNWGSFGTLIQQLNQTQRNDYQNNLNRVYRDFDPHHLNLNSPVDSLNKYINSGNPAAGIGSFSNEWSGARHDLNIGLQGSGLNSNDQHTILSEFDRLNYVWNNSYHDIQRAYYDRPRNMKITEELPTHYDYRDTRVWAKGQDILLDKLIDQVRKEPAKGLGNFKKVFDELFNARLFTDIAFYGGVQKADVRYFNNHYHKELPVVGINTVEQFKTTWEARWSAQVSFERSRSSYDADDETTERSHSSSGFNPLILNGQFAMMYNPVIGYCFGGTAAIRVISSLGIDIGTYAPAHVTAQNPHNKGFATGGGPQVGAGFALVAGPLTSYTMGTLSYGDVNCPGMENDRYRSCSLEAGVRYLNKLTVKYEMRSWDWTKRTADRIKNAISQQITIGMPIDCLFR